MFPGKSVIFLAPGTGKAISVPARLSIQHPAGARSENSGFQKVNSP
jgi:hypothetical protein